MPRLLETDTKEEILRFPTWSHAEEYFMREIYTGHGDAYDAFEFWSEEKEIIITEAEEIAESDAYDLANCHAQ